MVRQMPCSQTDRNFVFCFTFLHSYHLVNVDDSLISKLNSIVSFLSLSKELHRCRKIMHRKLQKVVATT